MKPDNNVVAYPKTQNRDADQTIKDKNQEAFAENQLGSVKFEVHGLEMLDKQVKQSGNSGRIYLPPHWVGKRVKIIRVD
ncbi:DUF2080 family transposase-associated protein [Dethiosulfatarculus sandiegensis]|uniref:Uncharacterized protein n=1 Tax=Dethiosulfatarculus sandiegensis TaxID=1429043 RepID=A0A0D2G9W2_9BACT|nr:DUF2080 family transposase-associated protein [Dethiosulfatarculus sandiegensis]KIX11647.1 hypothetical protein X474_23225 [Dethiosulfatarculus sandiegensis]